MFMTVENLITNATTAVIMWITAFAVYMLCNKGVARNARGQQLRRYLFSSILAFVPLSAVNASILQPAVGMAAAVALAWIVTFPLLYHLTNRKTATGYDNQIDIAFGIYMFGLLTGLLATFPSFKYVIGLVEFALLMVPVAMWIYYFVCKECINVNGMKMLQETHYNEIIEFLRSYHPAKVSGAALCIACLCGGCMAINILFGFDGGDCGIVQKAIAGGVTVFMAVYSFKPHHGLLVRTGIWNLYVVVKDYVDSNSRYITDRQQRMDKLTVAPIVSKTHRPQTVVMVIGESASRDFMSTFTDVDVETTPWMTAMRKDNPNCIIYRNAYSCDVQTVPSLEKALTEYNQYEDGEFHTSCSIVDIAHKLGWKVHWYSNQGHLGAADTPITLVAETADVAKWTCQELNKIQYDESLIEFLDEVSPDTDNLLVLHLKGSHFNFENRFPRETRQWGTPGDNDNITNYKNSLYYTDSVLQRFFDYGRRRLNMQAMVYFSDHACVPDRHRLPNFGGFGDIRIPLMVWMSDEYVEQHPARAAALKANAGCFWTNDLAYELMCGIMDIKSNRFDESNSLASSDYKYTREMLVSMGGKIKISNDTI